MLVLSFESSSSQPPMDWSRLEVSAASSITSSASWNRRWLLLVVVSMFGRFQLVCLLIIMITSILRHISWCGWIGYVFALSLHNLCTDLFLFLVLSLCRSGIAARHNKATGLATCCVYCRYWAQSPNHTHGMLSLLIGVSSELLGYSLWSLYAWYLMMNMDAAGYMANALLLSNPSKLTVLVVHSSEQWH